MERLVSGDARLAVQHARGLAEALVDEDRDGTRLRMIAKALAAERTLFAILERVATDQVARGDLRGVRVANEALRGAVARLERLTAIHRAESIVGQRTPVVMIGHADSVRVGGT